MASTAVLRKIWCDAFEDLYRENRIKRTEHSIEQAMPVLFHHARSNLNGLGKLRRKIRVGTASILEPPGPKALLRWLRAYDKNGKSVWDLVPQYHRSGNRYHRFDLATEALIGACLETYASDGKPSKRATHELVKRRFREANKERAENNAPRLHCPSRRTVYARLALMTGFRVYARRHGIAAAKRAFNIYELGLQTTRPLERVEIDEWKIDLISLFALSGVLEHLNPKLIEAVEKGRRWLYVAIDHCTRCILAMRIVENPCSEEAINTLADITRDKTGLARAAGCECKWNQFGTPEIMASDQGTGFANTAFVAATTDLGISTVFPPGGVPTNRARIERVFGTFGTRIMPYLSGRTFENPKARGDYDSEYWAALSDDDLMQILVSYVVDIYHNQEHEGLHGETPAQCWARLMADPDEDRQVDPNIRRSVFGLSFERSVTGRGVTVLGVDYTCEALRDHYIAYGATRVQLRIDPNDVGFASIELDGAWYAAKALQSNAAGVSMAQWHAALQHLQPPHSGTTEYSQGVMDRALDRVTKNNRRALLRKSLTLHALSAAQLDRAEDEMMLGVSIITPEHPELEPPAGAGLMEGAIEIKHHAPASPHEEPSAPKPQPEDPKPLQPKPARWTMEDE